MDEIKRAQDSSADPPEAVALLQQLDVLEQTVDNLRRRLGHSEQERQKLLTTLSYQGNSGLVDRIFSGLREMSDEIYLNALPGYAWAAEPNENGCARVSVSGEMFWIRDCFMDGAGLWHGVVDNILDAEDVHLLRFGDAVYFNTDI